MATITFKVQQKSSKIKSDKIDQLLADLGCIVGIVSAIQSGVIIKQFVFSNIEGGIAHPICHTLTKSLGTFDARRCFGEAFEDGDIKTLTEAQVKKLVAFIENNTNKYDFKSLKSNDVIPEDKFTFIIDFKK